MRTVFAFPAGRRADTVALLTHPRDGLYISIEDEGNGTLYVDWDPDELAVLEEAVGHRPGWAVQIDISGRIDGTAEVHDLLAVLLADGGVAFDDYTTHAWTLPEIQNGTAVDGLRFFDFHTYHARKLANDR
ncbi:hypothetical protein GCM10010112_13740 [Actinoplanes lobatus]|uniref:Uncharacterized protein n=1 Tax=Actinoplanes lobatus TaxID=113568 RepID=A0A7W7MKB8_9ACTN|nr:hypothetical protein [Actinoplanes lobatus]MBB4753211.1 hypothetical protein [Actinoplanes lobatus]GGN59131.1 hypothetical protein GCM10010112_13740 [Actinoplanes lobatus]GIE42929.1 hypothetical protein Alo02nite_58270 [Actinoplanes lobatus]